MLSLMSFLFIDAKVMMDFLLNHWVTQKRRWNSEKIDWKNSDSQLFFSWLLKIKQIEIVR